MSDIQNLKPQLKQYLTARGVDASKNPAQCFSPDHSDTGKKSCLIYDDHFECQACGINGDIFDACGILTGKLEFKEQKSEVMRTLGIMENTPMKAVKKPTPEPQFEDKAIKAVSFFMKNHTEREGAVKKFLHIRGYKGEIVNTLWKKYGYWPGMEKAKHELGKEVLEKSGVPMSSAWNIPGVVVKLNFGWKLLRYRGGECEKRNSTLAKTFPMPSIKEDQKIAYLVEAETSCNSMLSAGFKNVHSTGGVNGINKKSAEHLKDLDLIYMLFDGDNPGRYHAGLDKVLKNAKSKEPPKRAIDKIREGGFKGAIKAVEMADGKDPDDYIRTGYIDRLKAKIELARPVDRPPGEKKAPPAEPTTKKANTKKGAEKSKKSLPINNKPVEKKSQPQKAVPFRFLGYESTGYYFLSQEKGVVFRISSGDSSIKNNIKEIYSKTSWWMNRFKFGDDEKPKLDHEQAIEWIRENSFKAGIFDQMRVKGVGVYKIDNDIIMNSGDKLIYADGREKDFFDYDGNLFFVKSKRVFDIKHDEWTIKEGMSLKKEIDKFNFEDTISRIAVLGYMVLSPFSGCLDRNPSMWITAERGSGKSYLLDEFIVPACGGHFFVHHGQGTIDTQAGIRNSVKTDRVPVILDEFEAENEKDRQNLKDILTMLTSSYTGAIGRKSNASQGVVEFELQSMFCLASVNLFNLSGAKESRIAISRMTKGGAGSVAPEDFSGMRKRTFYRIFKILDDLNLCRKKIIEDMRMSSREADTYAPFFAGAWNLLSDDDFMTGENKEIIGFFANALEDLLSIESTSDEDKIILRILQQRIYIESGVEKTIAEMLTERNDSLILTHEKALQLYGLKRCEIDGKDVLAISLTHNEITKILDKTAFAEYKEILKRNPCIIDKQKRVTMAGNRQYCAVLDWVKFEEKYIGTKETKQKEMPF